MAKGATEFGLRGMTRRQGVGHLLLTGYGSDPGMGGHETSHGSWGGLRLPFAACLEWNAWLPGVRQSTGLCAVTWPNGTRHGG